MPNDTQTLDFRNLPLLYNLKGMKQASLARKAGLSQAYISKLVNNQRRNISLAALERLAAALGFSVPKLLEALGGDLGLAVASEPG